MQIDVYKITRYGKKPNRYHSTNQIQPTSVAPNWFLRWVS